MDFLTIFQSIMICCLCLVAIFGVKCGPENLELDKNIIAVGVIIITVLFDFILAKGGLLE